MHTGSDGPPLARGRSCGRWARGSAVVTISILGACSLGLVDVPIRDPEPARFIVHTRLMDHPDDPARVQLTFRAVLDPGISSEHTVRRVADDRIRIGGETYRSTFQEPGSRRLVWTFGEVHPRPGPRRLAIGAPRIAGLPTPDGIEVQVGLRMSVSAPLVPGSDDDLTLSFDPVEAALPTPGPFSKDRIDWRLDVRASTTPGAWTRRANRWIEELRIPATELPESDAPLQGELRVLLLHAPATTVGEPPSQYRIEVESTIERSFQLVVGGR